MMNFLSRYRLRYARSLTYMLQVCEYNVGDYLAWYHRTKDFAHVEKRKHLVRTRKALLLWAIAWALILVMYAGSIAIGLRIGAPVGLFLAAAGVLSTPFLVAYLEVLPLVILRLVVQRPIESFVTARARHKLQSHPGFKMAIAGSFGKTSMREILRTVLAEGKRVAAPPHSYNTPLGISRFIEDLNGDEQILIFELGEYYPGDIKRLCHLTMPELGVITGVNEAHLSKFKSLKRTAHTIFELADWVGDKPLWVNGESELSRDAAPPKALVYSRMGVDHWKVSNASTSLLGTEFDLKHAELRMHVHSQLLGLHQVGPLVAAADIALRVGLTPTQIKRGLELVKPFDHRLQPRLDADGITVLDDSYNGNPSGVKAVVDFLGGISDHRRFYVTPGLVEMGSSTSAVHRQIGRQLAQAGIEQVVLIRNSATPHIAAGLASASYKGNITWFEDGPSAFAALPELTVRGDVVLLQNDWPDQYS
jgi:UDP-N-acetylmuramoyl-tripeptide--D-alanyl-D-alanine ligase